MSRVFKMVPTGSAFQFKQSIGYGDHLLSIQEHVDKEIQWFNEGDTAWKYIPKFQDPSTEFGFVDSYPTGYSNSAVGIDYSRNVVFFSNSAGLHSCSFDSSADLEYITTNNVLGRVFSGKIGVDEVNGLLFVVDSGAIRSFSYDNNGDNITFIQTLTGSISAQDLVIDAPRQLIFAADRHFWRGMLSFTYTNLGIMTPVSMYSASNHGFGAVQIDTVNRKLFGSHWYFNSPVGIETLSYDDFAVIIPVDMAAPASGTYSQGESLVVDLTRNLAFLSYYDAPVVVVASFSFDSSFNLTPITAETGLSLSYAPTHSSIDTTKKFLLLSVDGVSKIEYNDSGTSFTKIASIPSLVVWANAPIVADEFLFVCSENNGFRTYTYDSIVERGWASLCLFEGNLYGTAYGNLARLDYVGPGWDTTKICDYKSLGVSEFVLSSYGMNSIVGHDDGKIYGIVDGALYRTNSTFDAWEQVAPAYIDAYGRVFMAGLTSFNGRVYGTGGSITYRLNLAEDAWELFVDLGPGDTLGLEVHKNRLYVTVSSYSYGGQLYVLNDTEDDWVYLSRSSDGIITKPVTDGNFMYFGTYNTGYGSPGDVLIYLENYSTYQWIGIPDDGSGVYPSPARLVQAPAVMNGKPYFCANGALYRLDVTFPCVANMYFWEKDQYFYGWIGPGLGLYSPYTNNENFSVGTAYLARSADGVAWDEVSTTALTGPQWRIPSIPRDYNRGNYAPLSIWADFNSYLYCGANRLTEGDGSYATISRSSDGTIWNEVFYLSSNFSTVKSFMIFGSYLYVAVEVVMAGGVYDSEHTISRIYRTSDGVTWDLIKTFDEGYGTFEVVEAFQEYDNKMYMSLNLYVHVSSDGINWENTQGYLGQSWGITYRGNPNSLVNENDNKLLYYASDSI